MSKEKFEDEKEITIDYKEINRTIKILTKSETIIYDPYERKYFMDGFVASERFINDTLSKFSHFVNSVANMKLKAKTGSIEAYKKNKKELVEITDESNEEKQILKPVKDENGEIIKYQK